MFARQYYRLTEAPDLSRFVATEFSKKDPCLNCTLPICDETRRGCQYVLITERTPRPEEYTDEDMKADIVAILRKLKEDTCTTA